MSRILIFAEAVTLAHVARPIALSRILSDLGHEVCIASAPAAHRWIPDGSVSRVTIQSIESQTFLRALARGTPAYDLATLKQYVADDLHAIGAWNPDVVIGDFRLSLYISSRLADKPYGAIANACWSRRYWPGVDAPTVSQLRWLPRSLADPLFRVAYPLAFALHALPFRRACRRFGVMPPRSDLRDIYTASDLTAFADVEAFYEPRTTGNDTHHFIGPLAWEPPGSPPLPEIPDGPPVVFVSMGTSGSRSTLVSVLEAVAGLPVRCIVAIGSSEPAPPLPSNCVHAAAFVAYGEACARAAVVICNGGAPAVYAALANGCEIIAIPENLDQILNTRALARAYAARSRIRRVVPRARAIVETVRTIIAASAADAHAVTRGREYTLAAMADDHERVAQWLRSLLEIGPPKRRSEGSAPRQPT
jgi:UDP:flavonoid glycosyltransferase YjiC (YdhE family)